MLRRKIGTTLVSFGIVMVIFGVSTLPALGAEPTHVALQPSPRPAIDPLKHHSGSSVEMGHITGTVIDQRTGAPAAGVIVSVGGDRVPTDANGNYDHWLPVGDYPVALDLAGAQGVAEQDTVLVSVQPSMPTLRHLSFHSLVPAVSVPAAAPAIAPIVVAAVPTAVAAQPAPPAIHTNAATPKVSMDPSAPPKRMPRTGSGNTAAWLWMAFGMMLLLSGGLVGFGPVLNGRSAAALIRTHAANRQLLYALLSQPARDEFLAALFDAHDRGRR